MVFLNELVLRNHDEANGDWKDWMSGVRSEHDPLVIVGYLKQQSVRFAVSTSLISDSYTPEHHNVNSNLSVGSDGDRCRPPANFARFAFLFVSTQNRESFIGDLKERYAAILQQKGRRSATRWFWREVFFSFLSLALDAVKKISGLERLFRRIGS